MGIIEFAFEIAATSG